MVSHCTMFNRSYQSSFWDKCEGLRTKYWLSLNLTIVSLIPQMPSKALALSIMSTCRLNYVCINWAHKTAERHAHTQKGSSTPFCLLFSFCVCMCVYFLQIVNKLLTNNSTTKAKKKWTQLSSVTVSHDWSGVFIYWAKELFHLPPSDSGSPRSKMAKWETFNTFAMTGFPLDKRNCVHTHTHTHRPHKLAKGLSLQMSWVIFHYPGSEESSV